MIYRILVLGASYGSLFATECLMADHDVTLVCRKATAELINAEGTDVRLALKGEAPRAIRSADLPGRLDATTPELTEPSDYDLAVLAMQEPQYAHPDLRGLLTRVDCLDDRRGIYTELTGGGHELLDRARPVHEAALAGALEEAHRIPELAPLLDALPQLALAAR